VRNPIVWSAPCWPVWGSQDGEVGSIFSCDRIFYGIWCLVLWLRVGDGNSKLLHDLMQLDILCLSRCASVVHRFAFPGVLLLCIGVSSCAALEVFKFVVRRS